jgi:Protein of unknown function (DUF3455)
MTPCGRTLAAALALTLTVALPEAACADGVTPPSVPPELQVPAGNKAFLVGHAVGTQNYICTSSASSPSGVAYTLFAPEAVLYGDDGSQVISHFFSPNPSEANTSPSVVASGTIRATWRHSRDTSTVWGALNPKGSVVVSQDAIAQVLLKVVGTRNGPKGGNTLSKTTFVQRLNTTGGIAPTSGCASAADVGHQASVPYTADYFFFAPDP